MSVIDLIVTPGVNDTTYGTPSISRTTGVPTSESYSMCCWIKPVTYQDFLHLFASEGTPQTRSMFVEGDGTGNLYNYENNGGANQDFWTDANTIWNFVCSAGRTANIIGYRFNGTVWTTVTTIASPAGAHDRMSFGSEFQFAADAQSHYLLRSLRVWNAELTLQEFKAEAMSVKPRRLTNLTFWNAGQDSATWNVDLSGTGGAFTKNGASPATSADDPGIPWQRLPVYGYGIAA